MTEHEFQRAFQDHKDAVYGFALRMTGSVQVAEDVAQDCFVELLRKPYGWNAERGSMRQYLLGMARNRVFRYWRADQRMDPLGDEAESVTPSLNSGPVAVLIGVAVQSLPPLQREALLLFEYEGFTLEEIAKLVGVDAGTVKSRLHRARERLRHLLTPLKNGSGGRML